MSASLRAEQGAMPPAVGFAQEKVFQDELRFAGGKRSSAGWACYPGIDTVGQSLSSNHLVERPAVRADEIDLRGLDEQVFAYPHRHWTAAMTLT